MFESKLITQFPAEIIATDEVGRGPLGGPVVVGAVRIVIHTSEQLKLLVRTLRASGIKDSKVLTEADRQKIFSKLGIVDAGFREKESFLLKSISVEYVTWEMDHEVIDQENILAASLRGMKEASQFLAQSSHPTTVLIDGKMKLRWGKDSSPWNEIPIIKGDSKSVLIGLASIIAKSKRDGFMLKMHEVYPQYGFNSHFGYPTAQHREAIKTHGPCTIHRKTFKGVKEYVSSLAN